MEANPFVQFLDPMVMARLTLLPIVLQIIKGRVLLTGAMASIITPVVVLGLTIWGGISAGLTVWTVLAQFVLGWLYCELVYTKIIEPMSESTNAVIPESKEA